MPSYDDDDAVEEFWIQSMTRRGENLFLISANVEVPWNEKFSNRSSSDYKNFCRCFKDYIEKSYESSDYKYDDSKIEVEIQKVEKSVGSHGHHYHTEIVLDFTLKVENISITERELEVIFTFFQADELKKHLEHFNDNKTKNEGEVLKFLKIFM